MSLLGAIDMRGFIGIDDEVFERSHLASLIHHSEKSSNRIGRFRSELARSLKCKLNEIAFADPAGVFSQIPLFGKGITLRLPNSATLGKDLIETASDLIRTGVWNIDEYIMVEDGPGFRRKVSFEVDTCISILNSAKMSIEFWISSPGIIILQIDLESADAEFVHYWYPCNIALEIATYDIRSLGGDYFNTNRTTEQSENIQEIRHRGEFNLSLETLRMTLFDLFKPKLTVEYPRYQFDQIEGGFSSIIRCSSADKWREVLKIVVAHNEYADLPVIKTDVHETYLGWASSCVITDEDYICEVGSVDDAPDAKIVHNLKLCIFVYNVFFFYERHLGEVLRKYVFTGQGISSTLLRIHRKRSDAIYYLGDLRRVSLYGSDRKLFDLWIDISGLDYLRVKTQAAIDLIISRLEEGRSRRFSIFAMVIAILTFILGLSSIVVWIAAMQDYFEKSDKNLSPADLLNRLENTQPGHLLFYLYAAIPLFLCLSILFGAALRWRSNR